MALPKIVSIGAAVQDVFLQGEIFKAHKDDDGDMVETFEMGTKNDIDNVYITTGGGSTNAAVTFARQGFPTAFLGRVGNDLAGKAIMADLQADNVSTKLVHVTDKLATGYSALLLAPNGERTILTYRGASVDWKLKTADFQNVRPDWFYITTLSGDLDSLKKIMTYARKHHIKVAINPGKKELKKGHSFKQFLPDISILSVNKEEAQMLFRGDTSEELARHVANHIPFVIITDGPKGSVGCDGKQIYKAGMYDKVPVVDRTGAGDAFSSGFTAMIAAGEPMEKAILFASANSTSVVSHLGAKPGIIKAGAHLHTMPMIIHPVDKH